MVLRFKRFYIQIAANFSFIKKYFMIISNTTMKKKTRARLFTKSKYKN